ncbi:Xanthine-guanine phosphoribosyltransferase [Granulibacter bethesdensis]|uniref:Xanthine-guanine phosphoribosyltransferase n=2 Tax=Granulibacter bethesdensis TaxID=364410 RepID=A0AAN0VFN5_9PROT|nr:Xanthine-guanine phosphoribosyltransferase [Granulibacter bethesdensis]
MAMLPVGSSIPDLSASAGTAKIVQPGQDRGICNTDHLMAERYYTVTWDQLHRDAKALAWRLIEQPWQGIVAVTRGGLIPAAIIARELECRLVESVSVMTYEDEARGLPVVTKMPDAAGDGTGFLVIDDLVDTGTTLRAVRTLLPKAHFACLYAKPDGKDDIDTFVTEVSQDTWILFPWDTEPQFVAPIKKQTV